VPDYITTSGDCIEHSLWILRPNIENCMYPPDFVSRTYETMS
jgi:hypothetical protein